MSLRAWLGWIVTIILLVSTYFFFTRVENFWEGNDIFYIYADYGLLVLWYIIATEEKIIDFESLGVIIVAPFFVILLWPLFLNEIVKENSVAITKFLYKPIPGMKKYHERNGL